MSRAWTMGALIATYFLGTSANGAEPGRYELQAREVTDYIQRTFLDARTGLYVATESKHRPDFAWGQGVALANLVAAARVEPDAYRKTLDGYVKALDVYWDAKAKVPGYEPSPTRGNGDDKYYDDNAWIVLSLLEAYETDHNPKRLERAEATLRFALSGWDDAIGGGIWWHEGHKDGTKNTCSNAPTAVGCLRLARVKPDDEAAKQIDEARRIVAWTRDSLQTEDGLYHDRKVVATGEIKRGKLTYNAGLMLRAFLGLYRATGDESYLREARRISDASDWFISARNGVYRDDVKFAHLLVEADLEFHRTTGDAHALDRARRNVDAFYAHWQADPPADMISNASIARILWLFSETETDAGREFWSHADKPRL
ncbi:glycoside hydrolase family 76 protein [Paludisphaera rhizosphaerae]|uniref:glycoside hydrolase family 76 protein n=1 Tax=Paludisphaera rhizosphaerae TaxID=2711216 RepID=UPI0013EA3CE6|nr:glycoside hydrolase family 76 protein [Paludisphaera rhizosphaerae]